MATQSPPAQATEDVAGPANPDRLFRVTPEVYRGMSERGLLPEGGKVALADGLLVDEETGLLHPITLDVYQAMTEHGLLTKYDRIELLDGLMVEKMTKGCPHVAATILLGEALRGLGLAGFHVKQEDPVALPGGPMGRDSVPEPDVSLVRGGPRDYLARYPGPGDVALAAEVADSSVRKDRAGLARYARSGIPVVWLVNLVDGAVEVYSGPAAEPSGYEVMARYGPSDEIPVVIGGREVGRVAVKDILP